MLLAIDNCKRQFTANGKFTKRKTVKNAWNNKQNADTKYLLIYWRRSCPHKGIDHSLSGRAPSVVFSAIWQANCGTAMDKTIINSCSQSNQQKIVTKLTLAAELVAQLLPSTVKHQKGFYDYQVFWVFVLFCFLIKQRITWADPTGRNQWLWNVALEWLSVSIYLEACSYLKHPSESTHCTSDLLLLTERLRK